MSSSPYRGGDYADRIIRDPAICGGSPSLEERA